MSSRKQRSAVLNQTIFPHELNNGITIRITNFAVINKNSSFIDRETIKRYILSYLVKYGIHKEKAQKAYEGETIDVQWRDRSVRIRVTSEGECSNSVIKVFAQFYTKGYIINGYEDEKQIYELSVSHIPTSILSASISDQYTVIFTDFNDEMKAKIDAGIIRRCD